MSYAARLSRLLLAARYYVRVHCLEKSDQRFVDLADATHALDGVVIADTILNDDRHITADHDQIISQERELEILRTRNAELQTHFRLATERLQYVTAVVLSAGFKLD